MAFVLSYPVCRMCSVALSVSRMIGFNRLDRTGLEASSLGSSPCRSPEEVELEGTSDRVKG